VPGSTLTSADPVLSEATASSATADVRSRKIAHVITLSVLFAAPAILCAHAACVNDPDIWWHLRTGEWIQQHHAIPRVDPFSAPNAGKPWQPYSWLYEFLVINLFQRFGLAGIVGYSASLVLAITVAIQRLIQRLQPDFSIVAGLTFLTFFSIEHLFTPRPWMFTILFFVLELGILMDVRRTGRIRQLAWLPLIFAAWANIHIQFIDGLVLLGIALVECVASRWLPQTRTALRTPAVIGAIAASVLATFANPFGWHIYRVAYDLASQPGVVDKIYELQAMHFRNWSEFCVLFLALGASSAMGASAAKESPRRFRVFEVLLLLFAAQVSFRSARDMWVMAIVAVVIIASNLKSRNAEALSIPRFAVALSAAAAALLVWGSFHAFGINDKPLNEQIAGTLPANAVHAIQAHHYAGPLYNDFTWGGYLMWELRMPVSLDGRAAFYGDAAIDRSVATWSGQPDWASDPQLKSASIVIGPDKSPLVQLLRTDPHFQLAYEDKLAAVFVARR
jgi:hypothetical protein